MNAGDKLGPYEIVAAIGKGGMGEVYRARDSRVGRDVAIKTSAERFGERFEREARAIAALNHPNICTLFDVGPNYLVMELVEGSTLAERIEEGAIPLEESLAIARQIAGALEAAHEKGITHRDLKPGNVILKPDGSVKVLDFGLAKVAPSGSAVDQNSPTLSMAATQAGVILGTAAYMAPEQARGKNVDKRADIWAFGAVLYEMVTGKKLFAGEDLTETLASVVMKEPDLRDVPQPLRRLLTKCLQKDPQKRLRDISGVELFLDNGLPDDQPQAESSRAKTRWIPWAGWAIAAVLGAIALISSAFRQPPEAASPNVVRFDVAPPSDFVVDQYGNAEPVSPDGKHMLMLYVHRGQREFWMRDLDSLEQHKFASGSQYDVPFWAPDSSAIGFTRDRFIQRVDLQGGPALLVCESSVSINGATWSTANNGTIVFAAGNALFRVPAAGGMPKQILNLKQEPRWPWFLPDGNHFLFSTPVSPSTSVVYVSSLDAPDSREPVRIAETASNAIFLQGNLVFARDNTLIAQPFDLQSLQTRGEAQPLAENVSVNFVVGLGHFHGSANGVLTYMQLNQKMEVTWFDRSGKKTGKVGPSLRTPEWTRISPDEQQAAFNEGFGANRKIVVHGLARETSSPLQPGTYNMYPVWSPGGDRIAYSSVRNGQQSIYVTNLESGREDLLLKDLGDPKIRVLPEDWSPDGQFLSIRHVALPDETWILPLMPDHKPVPFARTNTTGSRFSPDGKWIAYRSDESGRSEIWVQGFPQGKKVQVSTVGANRVAWSKDGRELFFITMDGTLMAVPVRTGASIEIGEGQRLFSTGSPGLYSFNDGFDVTRNGRFLIPVAAEDSKSGQPTVVLNWTALLRK